MGKKKEVEKEIPKPELSSYLKNFIKKEGESIEMKCRLEEEYEEGDIEMKWYFNDTLIESSDRCMITFDGSYATLFIASCTMEDMGAFKVVFSNKSGSDESTGKVTVKPKPVEKKVEDEKKKKEEKKPEPKPEPKPFKMPKKVEKKPEPEPEPEPEPAFKLPKKKVSRPVQKEEPKEEEESPFGKIKLKKAGRVQRTWDEPTMETVDLKHHEFEKPPQDPEPEGKSTVKLGISLECDLDDKEEKPKKKKKKQKKETEEESESFLR